jgi:hypothetical protein
MQMIEIPSNLIEDCNVSSKEKGMIVRSCLEQQNLFIDSTKPLLAELGKQGICLIAADNSNEDREFIVPHFLLEKNSAIIYKRLFHFIRHPSMIWRTISMFEEGGKELNIEKKYQDSIHLIGLSYEKKSPI